MSGTVNCRGSFGGKLGFEFGDAVFLFFGFGFEAIDFFAELFDGFGEARVGRYFLAYGGETANGVLVIELEYLVRTWRRALPIE